MPNGRDLRNKQMEAGETTAGFMEILVAEDEKPIRSLWERFLAKWGFRAVLAEHGQAALELARENDYQLVITDLTMPVLSGQELIYTLKAEQPEVEFIVTTGNGTIEVAVEMMKAGAYDFLTKPINFGYAELVVRKCLENAAARRENRRLRRENRDLEELNELKERFIAITGHELRTPVSVISNVVEMLQPRLTENGEETLCRLIKSSSQQLNEIVGQMHELSRIHSTKLELMQEDFPLRPLCQELWEEVTWVLQKRGHALSLGVSEELSLVADRVKFKKVLRELLQNAIKFTKDGGDISIDAEVGAEQNVCISIRDTGVGISAENLDKIFHLFYEVGDPLHHHTSKEAFLGGGMGVGLAIVREVVAAHGGRVTVESEVGQGSRFTVSLPQTVAE
jgi:signal transduction histidine kinase